MINPKRILQKINQKKDPEAETSKMISATNELINKKTVENRQNSKK